MLGICIPVHNEETDIQACLDSVIEAAHCPRLAGERVLVSLVLDDCSDASAAIARGVMQRHRGLAHCRLALLPVALRNVGRARAQASRYALGHGARWLAFTDADSTVSRDWLAEQLALDCDVVCGTVSVRPGDWLACGAHADLARQTFLAGYEDRDGHRHVHGANLGMSARIYQASGGFRALACGEDQQLVDRLGRMGARIAWSARPRVQTSGRMRSRIDGGFATALGRAAA
ncbi:MAG: hypothetical protein GAK30_03694 [Paracidovorax wautersii]|uniref:Glycosyltransferase 2-like domain-containing protein n=1 Tax=Paracidovorax wautersii TaxID=1177982 RepID=A0A7V8FKN5_9BURK|nr:MAG: hypothetical protein GAK30_03694 [Paracidovorax wautersii]